MNTINDIVSASNQYDNTVKKERNKISGRTIGDVKLSDDVKKYTDWKEMIANILNVTVETPEIEEGPAMGGAMLAAVGCGVFRDVEEAAEKIVRIKDTLEPTPEIAARYEEKYQLFRKLYPALKGIYQSW